MTAKAKQILITTESREVIIVRRPSHASSAGHCPVCRELLISAWPEAIRSDAGAIDLGAGHILICARTSPAGYVDSDGAE
jgi:hypothetical protein